MRVTEYGAQLVQLTRFPLWFPVNAYFVREEDGLTLIDAGIPGMAKMFLAAAARLGRPIRRIALTHAHMDHVGALDALHAALPGAEVLIGAREARLLAGDLSLDVAERELTPKLNGSFPKVKTRPTRELVSGDRVGSLRVVAAPGHSPGQIAYYDERDGSLIAGDAFQTRGGVAVSGVIRPTFPFPAMATWHKPTALATARALRALNPTRLAIGHGTVLEAPGAALDEAIAVAERQFGEAVAHAS